ncbi:cation-transporting P-type ATPase [Mycoplasma sp. 1331]|uniref:Cation-transporting P-type ATPase n=1 Tax=Mycoplasma tauri TaxID=547987 RepID=A0A953NDU7_9MOLU|nr:cation-transporting P-type ATPase [Mycoplasma tauri]MBZ4195112.1 cation-transporting P-type ATPase [Mycoplasma tauri]
MNFEEVKKYKGLTNLQVSENINKYGENTLTKKKKVNPIIAYLRQFLDPMVILLICAAAISFSLAIYEHVSNGHVDTRVIIGYVEPCIILLVILLNSALGAYQEVKSDQAVRALENSTISNVTVMREGHVMVIPANKLTVGDLVILAAGDTINADGRIIESSNFYVIESSLTGESIPVEKQANWDAIDDKILAKNHHIVYSGTYVNNGKATYLVTAIGKDTEIGKINSMIQNQKKTTTPLQLKLNKLSKLFGYAGIILLFVSFIMQILLNNIETGKWSEPDVYTNALVTGISLAVAAIPEGLIAFTTVILSIGVSKISKQNGLVKNLLAVETLGSASIICSDKTGTLTENKMTVVDVYTKDGNFLNDLNDDNKSLIDLIKLSCYCNDAYITVKDDKLEEIGDPTETGLLRFGYKYNIHKSELLEKHNILSSLPFDSDRKMMSVLVDSSNGEKVMMVKGAPDVILKKCININQTEIQAINDEWASKSYRVLAFAKKVLNKSNLDFSDEDDNFIFVGLVAMIDPPRASVAESISTAQKAGIKVVMITGDNLITAKAIATNLGIYNQDSQDICVDGTELKTWTDDKLRENVKNISVYARVNPDDKLRIVKAWQSHNMVVAMTGDGVNDAPALKASDIGCAMGITGTDVSKQSADLILTDDNFNTIVKSVKNGRLIFDKIKTVIMNLLITSVAEVFVMLIGLIAFYYAFKNYFDPHDFYVFSASQLLWINLLTHGLPAIALGIIDSGKDVMSRKPFDKKESLFARGMGIELIWQSIVISLVSLVSYSLGALYSIHYNEGKELLSIASTCGFITMGLATSINAINLINDKSIFRNCIKRYWPVYLSVILSVFSVLFVAFVPNVAEVFRMFKNLLTFDNGILLSWSISLAFVNIICHEIKKMIINWKIRKSNIKYSV